MPLERDRCICLRRTEYSETSQILTLFSREYGIQGYRVSGLVAIAHVYEHFAYHTGQIIYLTKLKRGKDLRFTRLPAAKPAARAAGRRP